MKTRRSPLGSGLYFIDVLACLLFCLALALVGARFGNEHSVEIEVAPDGRTYAIQSSRHIWVRDLLTGRLRCRFDVGRSLNSCERGSARAVVGIVSGFGDVQVESSGRNGATKIQKRESHRARGEARDSR